MKASGEVFTRKWTWDGPPAGVDLLAAAAALQPRPTAAANAGSAAAEASGALGCDGCIGPDSRSQVTPAASAAFPHTAIGASQDLLLCQAYEQLLFESNTAPCMHFTLHDPGIV